ncbi:phosphopantetheine-binding protein [Nonomuraea sp. NPDC049607]|uniref:phosphopantetheine-binding protein n=1 Tax=unclassified Nonomuraea TaxID=2593643 RepID=UPI003413FBB9
MTTVTSRDDLELESAYEAPRTDIERRLAGLWSAKLRVAPVGIEDDFFELGGDSLLAADVQFAIDREFGFEVPAWTLFLSPTIAELAEVIGSPAPLDHA